MKLSVKYSALVTSAQSIPVAGLPTNSDAIDPLILQRSHGHSTRLMFMAKLRTYTFTSPKEIELARGVVGIDKSQ